MNVGIDVRPLMADQRTGVGEYVLELTRSLIKYTDNNYYLYYNSYKNVDNKIRVFHSEHVHYVESRCPNKILNISKLLFNKPRLDKIVQKEHGSNLDWVIIPNFNFNSFSSDTKNLLIVHDLSFLVMPDSFDIKRRLWHKAVMIKKQCRLADCIVTPSQSTKRDLIDIVGIDSEKIQVIYPGLSLNVSDSENGSDLVRKKYSLPKRFILFLGASEPRKNIDALIFAYKEGGFKEKGVELIIAGAKGWKNSKLNKLIKNTKGVKHIGYVDEIDKGALYRLSEVFVYPSWYEGFGFPVLEAMNCGTPVITSYRSSLPEVAGDAAWFVNPMCITDLIQGLNKIIGSKTIKQKMIEKGQKRAQLFTWQKTALRVQNTLKTNI